jgi:hypothetical protein
MGSCFSDKKHSTHLRVFGQEFFYEIAENYRDVASFGITTEMHLLKELVPNHEDTATPVPVIVLLNEDDIREEFVITHSSPQKVQLHSITHNLLHSFVLIYSNKFRPFFY